MLNLQPDLEALASEFFREFARHEYCLKAIGLRKKGKAAEANWRLYAKEKEIQSLFEKLQAPQFAEAVKYYLATPPNKQVVVDGDLAWDSTLPDHESNAELILQLVCRARNNLFHGGKFNGHWFEPQRSIELLSHGLVILTTCAQAHPAVREAYAGRAV
jgi:hypothetical protein